MSNLSLTSYLNSIANDYLVEGDYGRYCGVSRASRVISQLPYEVHSTSQLQNIKFIGEGIIKKVENFFSIRPTIVDENPHKHYMLRNTSYNLVTPLIRYLHSKYSPNSIVIAGSYRRHKDIVGDLDLLIETRKTLKFKKGDELEVMTGYKFIVISGGQKKCKGILTYGNLTIEVDIVKCITSDKGTHLLYFTGPQSFNVELRSYVKSLGMSLNEYGITLKSGKLKKFKDEESIFKFLNIDYVKPSERI